MRDHWISSALSLMGGVHIGAGALLDIILIWFGYTACLSRWGVRGYFTRSNDFYLPSLHLKKERGGQHPVALTHRSTCQTLPKANKARNNYLSTSPFPLIFNCTFHLHSDSYSIYAFYCISCWERAWLLREIELTFFPAVWYLRNLDGYSELCLWSFW